MSKHTPGPWIAERVTGDPDRTTEVRAPDSGDEIAMVADDPSTGEHDANARLIAAAPDLLETCRAAEHYMDQPMRGETKYGTAQRKERLAALRAAIAKAETP